MKDGWEETVYSLKNEYNWRNPKRNAKTETIQLVKVL